MADLYTLYRMVTLRIMSRSSKSNQLFPPFQQCIYASMVNIHLLVQNKVHKTLFWTFQSASVTLKIKKSMILFGLLFYIPVNS